MKDNFSHSASCYSKFRPVYPVELYQFIYEHCSAFNSAWDAGTGNGQVALALTKKFESVFATDISSQQLELAFKDPKIVYNKEAAENCSAKDHGFDLIVSGQAVHWFDLAGFYRQVNRCLKPGGCIAVWVYENIIIDKQVNALIHHLYDDILGSYWDPERKIIENKLLTIEFPFNEISCPEFSIVEEWDRDQVLGYLKSWSAVQHFQKTNNRSPLIEIEIHLQNIWQDNEKKLVSFPVFMRMGTQIQ